MILKVTRILTGAYMIVTWRTDVQAGGIHLGLKMVIISYKTE